MKIKIRNLLAAACSRLASFFEEAEHKLRVCPDCGRNVWYGSPCKNRQ